MRPRFLVFVLACAAVAVGCADTASSTPGGDGATAADPAEPLPTILEGALTACVAATPDVAEPVDGDWQGFDIAVLDGVADELGLELEVVPTAFDEIVSGMAPNGGECDVAAAAVVDREALGAVARTSAPYRTVHRLVLASGATDVVAPDEVTGRVGVEDGSMAAAAADALTAAEVVAYPSRADLARAVVAGAVDAALVGTQTRPDLEAAVGAPLSLHSAVPTTEETVLLLPLAADDDLVAAVDDALVALREQGRLEALQDQWLRD